MCFHTLWKYIECRICSMKEHTFKLLCHAYKEDYCNHFAEHHDTMQLPAIISQITDLFMVSDDRKDTPEAKSHKKPQDPILIVQVGTPRPILDAAGQPSGSYSYSYQKRQAQLFRIRESKWKELGQELKATRQIVDNIPCHSCRSKCQLLYTREMAMYNGCKILDIRYTKSVMAIIKLTQKRYVLPEHVPEAGFFESYKWWLLAGLALAVFVFVMIIIYRRRCPKYNASD